MVQSPNSPPGWGPSVSVGPTSAAPGWGSPSRAVSPGTSSSLWVSTGPQSGSSLVVDESGSGSKKRSAMTSTFDLSLDPNGPSPSKRRMREEDAEENGYNSEDEYNHLGVQLTEEEWLEKDNKFEQQMRKKGYIIKKTVEDGSCLFRAVADQIYGDQEMHVSVRQQCMDYLVSL